MPIDKKQQKKTGHPRKYKTVEEMEVKIEKYFADRDKDKRPYLIYGLALALDLTRDGLLKYQGRKEFVSLIKKAKERVAASIEEMILTKRQVAGPIFWLKANSTWYDKLVVSGENGDPIAIDIVNFKGASKQIPAKSKNKR